MKCVVLTWIGENQDIRRNLPDGMPAHPARSSDTYTPGDRIVPASARHTVRRMQVATVAVASVAARRIAVVEEPDAVPVWAIAVTATLSAAAYSAAVRSSVSAFAAEVDMAVSVAAALASVAAPVPAVVVRNLP